MIAISQFKEICPYMTYTDICCTDAQVSIMKANFATSDSVFGEVGMCGLNLKKLWCEYTCSPYQTQFVNATGYNKLNFTDVLFSVDEDFACTVFRSCRKVSLVAQASLQSSKSFLDFLGVNGQNSSLSSIVFQFEALDNSTTTSNPLNIFNKNINGQCSSI